MYKKLSTLCFIGLLIIFMPNWLKASSPQQGLVEICFIPPLLRSTSLVNLSDASEGRRVVQADHRDGQ